MSVIRWGLPWSLLALAPISLCAAATPVSSPTVEAIRKAGVLTCGVDQSEAKYSMTDEHGSRVAFDRDLCDAVAASILGNSHRVVLKGYPDEDTALQALRNGEVDMVGTVSDDLTHSTLPGIELTRPVFYDWKGFLVPRSAGIVRAARLSGKKVCVLAETEAEVTLRAWFAQRHLVFVPFPFQEEGEMEAAFVTGNCTALFGDATRLANTRVSLGRHAQDYLLLPEPPRRTRSRRRAAGRMLPSRTSSSGPWRCCCWRKSGNYHAEHHEGTRRPKALPSTICWMRPTLWAGRSGWKTAGRRT